MRRHALPLEGSGFIFYPSLIVIDPLKKKPCSGCQHGPEAVRCKDGLGIT